MLDDYPRHGIDWIGRVEGMSSSFVHQILPDAGKELRACEKQSRATARNVSL
jgi:hypothetical protein